MEFFRGEALLIFNKIFRDEQGKFTFFLAKFFFVEPIVFGGRPMFYGSL